MKKWLPGLFAIFVGLQAEARDCAHLVRVGEALKEGSISFEVEDIHAVSTKRCYAGTDGQGDWICEWRFDLRALQAGDLRSQLDYFFAGCSEAQADIGVNHPDTSQLTHYNAAGFRASVAQKDKSALRATYVTLRLYLVPGD